MPVTTPEGKWLLWHAESGRQVERWSVDARGMIASGEYRETPPDGVVPILTPAPTPRPVVPPAIVPPEHPAGGPLNIVRAEDAGPAEPLQPPTRKTARKARS